MKILFFSDSHGSTEALGNLTLRIAAEKPDVIVMLGDALYHGPRNALPGQYDAKKAADMLNIYKKKLIAVRGNCDSEVDQMMLEYPIMADYSTILTDGKRIFLTHGHIWNAGNPPPVTDGTVLAHGHTHIPVLEQTNGLVIFNPGSIAIPKQNNLPTYGMWENGTLSIRDLKDGSLYNGMSMTLV